MNGIIYGYARISTKKQNIDRQIENISREYPGAIVIKEAYTGTTTDRPQWNKLVQRVQPGDTIVFDEVSRMSRNAEEGFKVYQELYTKGVSLVFLKERHIDTDVYRKALDNRINIETTTGRNAIDNYISGQGKLLNDLMMDLAKEQIELAFKSAQAEVDHLRIRTVEGLRQARLKGVNLGRKQGTKVHTQKGKETMEAIKKYSKDFDGMMPDSDIIKLLNVDRHTYYKYKAILKDGAANE